MTRPPLRTVAELAGVSEPTVSRVINGRTGVAEATRRRVVESLAELGFTAVPEQTRSRRGAVGIVSGELTNPVFPAIVGQITRRLARHGIVVTVGVAATDALPEERYVSEFRSVDVDGFVFVAGRHAEVDGDLESYRRLYEDGVPFVLVNGGRTGFDVPHVRCDESTAAEAAVEHLVALGHRRIGCVLGDSRYLATHRFETGFERAMRRRGLPTSADDLVHGPFTREGGQAGARRLFGLGVTALVCGNDLIALGAVGAARGLGLALPGEASIVGYDGTDIGLTSDPPLTTLRQPFASMGTLVADALVSEVERTNRFRDHYVFDAELIARSSSGSCTAVIEDAGS